MQRIFLSLIFFLTFSAHAEDLHVAVAANFAAPMQKISTLFTQETGHNVIVSLAATGILYTQIKNGAPFDILLAADSQTPQRLAAENLAVANSQFTYATGKLVLWSMQAHLIDDKARILQQGKFNHLAIANPKLAPYGAAAIETLTQLKLLDATQGKLVQGESIAQAYQFVASKNAELGFIALSQIYADGKIREGSAWIVPNTLYTPIKQAAIILKTGEKHLSASAFMQFLQSAKARSIISSYGYDI